MTIDELIRGIHDLGNYLKKFEEKYRPSRKISIGSQRQANWNKDICLRVLQVLDFDDEDRFIQRCSYEVSRNEGL